MAIDYILFAVLRFIQFVLAIAVCGLYGVDLHNASKHGVYADGKWVGRAPVRFSLRKSIKLTIMRYDRYMQKSSEALQPSLHCSI